MCGCFMKLECRFILTSHAAHPWISFERLHTYFPQDRHLTDSGKHPWHGRHGLHICTAMKRACEHRKNKKQKKKTDKQEEKKTALI